MSASPTALAEFEHPTGKPSVVEAFAAVMADVQAVGKEGRNQQQGYSFRGIDGVMNAVGPALRKHGVVVTPRVCSVNYREVEVGKNRTLQRECTIEVEFTVRGPAGDSFTGSACAEAMDSGDKATSKAHSVAYRTFLLQALTIPTHEPDPDEQSPERSSRSEPARPLLSPKSVENFLARCAENGLDPGDVVLAATDGRTDDPRQVFADEAEALREAMKAMPSTMPDGGTDSGS